MEDSADPADLVVLLDQDARPSGTAPRTTVHDQHTPLHLAFSCYLLDDEDRVLLTRRALEKRTWPGVWTNSFCGHPRPGERVDDAVTRYADRELGTTVRDLRCLLPDFRYRAVDPSGVVENEVCPVYLARRNGPLTPAPAEVLEIRWVSLHDLRVAVMSAPWALSPWLVSQVEEIESAGSWEGTALAARP
ncbi:isopentenyl-diphosphate Delta-isomerase [Aeromicrobium phragmitis]|uniref:Isopentenyl-diphosphate Delta-isomerase n=1 Tax=Aeromicrobium phragmitis TaxID=2478914 RepID=A0A3L8PN42_9ACTN|nr:isopentenyl-diphosphate Delta-isomerase [Aeromicrobium phragmitis]RLV56795.1 isopentenyl-diphosphate Delta-isomerase [Aeromicrobium phragmitis]